MQGAPTKLSSMLATLCSYEDRFGTNHPHTLALMIHAGIACGQATEFEHARMLLERALTALSQLARRDDALRLKAVAALRDVCAAEDAEFARKV